MAVTRSQKQRASSRRSVVVGRRTAGKRGARVGGIFAGPGLVHFGPAQAMLPAHFAGIDKLRCIKYMGYLRLPQYSTALIAAGCARPPSRSCLLGAAGERASHTTRMTTARWTMKTLNKLKADELEDLARTIGMKQGHVAKFKAWFKNMQLPWNHGIPLAHPVGGSWLYPPPGGFYVSLM